MSKVSQEALRIKEVRDFVLKRLRKIDELTILVKKIAPSLHNTGIDFQINRSGRKTEDPRLFLLTYNPTTIPDMTRSQLIVNVFHEVLHALSWDYEDEYCHTVKHIKSRVLNKELKARWQDACERVTYDHTRHLGPLIFPEVNPEDWEPETKDE